MILIRDKAGDHRKRSAHIIGDIRNFSITAHLIDHSVQHDHLAVEVFERSKSKVAIVEQEITRHRTIVNSLNKSPGC